MKMCKLYTFLFVAITSLFLVGCAHSATMMNGGVTVFDEETNVGKVEFCPVTFGSKDYATPSWIQHVMAPINNITSVVQIPVAVMRGPERVLEQSMSDHRSEGNPCLNVRYRSGQDFNTTMTYTDLNFGDSVTVGRVEVSVSITGDTE